MTDLNRLAVENKFSGLEKLKQIHLILDPFTIENDILTPTMKIKRNIAKKIFEKEQQELEILLMLPVALKLIFD